MSNTGRSWGGLLRNFDVAVQVVVAELTQFRSGEVRGLRPEDVLTRCQPDSCVAPNQHLLHLFGGEQGLQEGKERTRRYPGCFAIWFSTNHDQHETATTRCAVTAAPGYRMRRVSTREVQKLATHMSSQAFNFGT